jgi:hypothetical protein
MMSPTELNDSHRLSGRGTITISSYVSFRPNVVPLARLFFPVSVLAGYPMGGLWSSKLMYFIDDIYYTRVCYEEQRLRVRYYDKSTAVPNGPSHRVYTPPEDIRPNTASVHTLLHGRPVNAT